MKINISELKKVFFIDSRGFQQEYYTIMEGIIFLLITHQVSVII